MKIIDKKKVKNLIVKSKVKTFIKNIYINIDSFDFSKFLFYYKLFFKNINIISKKKIFKNKKSSRLKKRISAYIKKRLFF